MTRNAGSVLLVVLWIVIILAMLAFSVGRKTSIDLSLTQYASEKQKARILAYSGFIYALNELRNDKEAPDYKEFDSFNRCGAAFKPEISPEEMFGHVLIPGGFFDVAYPTSGDGMNEEMIFGFSDEERKLNINALDDKNYIIFKELLVLMASDFINDSAADRLAVNLIDWKDDDTTILGTTNPEDSEYAQSRPGFHVKNKKFDSIEELLLVKGMTEEVFKKIKDLITVFPKDETQLYVNIQTVSAPVLTSLARSAVGPATNTYQTDADRVVEELIKTRAGGDRKDGTADDRKILLDDVRSKLSSGSLAIMDAIGTSFRAYSKYFRIRVKGTTEPAGISSTLEAVVKQEDLSIIFWTRD